MGNPKLDTWGIEVLLQDNTRKERKILFVLSLISLFMSKGGFIPTEITALGIKFTAKNTEFMLYGTAAVTAFYTILFILNSVTDLLNLWMKKWSRTADGILKGPNKIEKEQLDQLLNHVSKAKWAHNSIIFIFLLRVSFEVLTPITIATYSIISVLTSV